MNTLGAVSGKVELTKVSQFLLLTVFYFVVMDYNSNNNKKRKLSVTNPLSYNIADKLLHRTHHGNNIKPDLFSDIFHHKLCSLHCRELPTQHDTAQQALEFSDDGTLLATGSGDGQVLVWSIEHVLNNRKDHLSKPMLMVSRNRSFVYCLALSPCNTHILSGGYQKIAVNDLKT